MARPSHDWYLIDWLKALGKKQAHVARDLDWNKAKVSLTASGKQPYTRDDINEIAAYLNLAPYELLLHPEDAMAIRRLRTDAIRIASTPDLRGETPQDEGAPKKFRAAKQISCVSRLARLNKPSHSGSPAQM